MSPLLSPLNCKGGHGTPAVHRRQHGLIRADRKCDLNGLFYARAVSRHGVATGD